MNEGLRQEADDVLMIHVVFKSHQLIKNVSVKKNQRIEILERIKPNQDFFFDGAVLDTLKTFKEYDVKNKQLIYAVNKTNNDEIIRTMKRLSFNDEWLEDRLRNLNDRSVKRELLRLSDLRQLKSNHLRKKRTIAYRNSESLDEICLKTQLVIDYAPLSEPSEQSLPVCF